MLHTLLPTPERRALRREYRIRALTVFLFALSVAGVLGVALLSPAFIRASAEQASAENDLSAIKKAKDLSGLTAIQQQVAIGQKLLGVLSGGLAHPNLSLLIEGLTRERATVRITSIDIAYTATTTVLATIQGLAPTRDMLLSFKSRLERDEPGSKVDLPVAELAKSTDIPFSIKVTLQTK